MTVICLINQSSFFPERTVCFTNVTAKFCDVDHPACIDDEDDDSGLCYGKWIFSSASQIFINLLFRIPSSFQNVRRIFIIFIFLVFHIPSFFQNVQRIFTALWREQLLFAIRYHINARL
jgi:hypothetical protein